MLDAGADHGLVVNAVYYSVPAETVLLTGLVLGQMQRDGALIWARVPRALLAATGAADEATDDTMTRMQRVAGMRVAALFKERIDGTVKLSLRSVPGINVAAVALTWGGGGHTQAAGANLPMDLDAAEAAVLPLLRQILG
jgi:phosphoesterase RecJ-like protein